MIFSFVKIWLNLFSRTSYMMVSVNFSISVKAIVQRFLGVRDYYKFAQIINHDNVRNFLFYNNLLIVNWFNCTLIIFFDQLFQKTYFCGILCGTKHRYMAGFECSTLYSIVLVIWGYSCISAFVIEEFKKQGILLWFTGNFFKFDLSDTSI